MVREECRVYAWAGYVASALITTTSMASGTNVETETLFFDEPMSPAHVEFVVGGFDTWGGARTLDAVDLTLDIVMSATVAAENDSQMPADDLSVFAQLFVLGSVAGDPLDCTNTVEVVSPGLGPSDGVSGSGPDYWEAGFVEVECNSSTTITEDLANYVDGQATVAVIDAIGFYTIFWTPDSTIDVIGFRGEGSLTVDYSYSLVSGACCLPSGDCLDTDILSCDDLGGAFSPGSDCGSHICAQPGACCFPDGSCQEADLVSGDGCVTAGGEYQGPDMPCSSVVCQLPTNACCLNNGMCNDLLEEDCLALGGIPNEGDCVSFFCPQPGACCFPDGSCALAENTNGSDCKQAGGAYQGKNSDCMTVSCPPAIGACCLNDGLCLPTIESACSTTRGH